MALDFWRTTPEGRMWWGEKCIQNSEEHQFCRVKMDSHSRSVLDFNTDYAIYAPRRYGKVYYSYNEPFSGERWLQAGLQMTWEWRGRRPGLEFSWCLEDRTRLRFPVHGLNLLPLPKDGPPRLSCHPDVRWEGEEGTVRFKSCHT